MKLVIAALLLLLTTAATRKEVSAANRWETSTGRPFAKRLQGAVGLSNVGEITPEIFRGGQPSLEGYRFLKEHGFKTVVSLRAHHDEMKAVEASGLKWVHIPLHADITGSRAPTKDEVRTFLSVVTDPKNQPVYFHCKYGEDRTGTMAAVYRMEVDGWTPDEALEEMFAFRAHRIFRSFIRFVRNYKPSLRRSTLHKHASIYRSALGSAMTV